ncbi:unnamed protein product, partial [Strongylus vulgaris]
MKASLVLNKSGDSPIDFAFLRVDGIFHHLMGSNLLRTPASLLSQTRFLLRPPRNLPYRGIYRTEGEKVRKDDILVCQRNLNYHPGLNVYFENDRTEKLLRSSCDGIVRITSEIVNPDMSNPEMSVYEHRKDVELRKLTFNRWYQKPLDTFYHHFVLYICVSFEPLYCPNILVPVPVMEKAKEGPNLKRDIHRILELMEHVQKTGEVSSPKLASLQAILQSEFFNAVREVYETVYDIVDIDGSPEVRASATAKATVAAFAAAEGHAHPRVVELPKTDQGLGFNVMGGKEQNSPIYISRIIPGGVADRHGGLRRGDQLIAVNGVVSGSFRS